MKLLFCIRCNDCFQLCIEENTYCKCGCSYGKYIDSLNAEITGPCLALGIDNHSLANKVFGEAADIKRQEEKELGHRIEAFVIPYNAPTLTHHSLEAIEKEIDRQIFKFGEEQKGDSDESNT